MPADRAVPRSPTRHSQRTFAQQTQRQLQLPPVHPRHHAALHPPLPSHVHAHVWSEEEGSRRKEGGINKITLLLGEVLNTYSISFTIAFTYLK